MGDNGGSALSSYRLSYLTLRLLYPPRSLEVPIEEGEGHPKPNSKKWNPAVTLHGRDVAGLFGLHGYDMGSRKSVRHLSYQPTRARNWRLLRARIAPLSAQI